MSALHSAKVKHRSIEGLREAEHRRRQPTNGRGRGRQGKRPAFGTAYVVGWVGEFGNIRDTPCWRFDQFSQPNQGSKRHRCADRLVFRP